MLATLCQTAQLSQGVPCNLELALDRRRGDILLQSLHHILAQSVVATQADAQVIDYLDPVTQHP
jgi:hypothetical protein